jgi:hypothetical protein
MGSRGARKSATLREGDSQPSTSKVAAMQIPFSGYAEDCAVTGQIELLDDRLSDFLASRTEFQIDSPAFTAIDDGRAVSAVTCSVARGDLCLAIATGPRGREDRRTSTRQHPVRAVVGPYVVLGSLHAPPTVDPFRTAERRPIMALTESVLEYARGGETVRVDADAILIYTTKIDALEPMTVEEIDQARRAEVGPSGIAQPVADDLAPGLAAAN